MNPINNSGKELENELEKRLIQNGIPYTRSEEGPKADIDFIIHTNPKMYIECHNQNTKGSVDEKIPHKVFKYRTKHGMNTMYIVKGTYPLNSRIENHIELLENSFGMKVEIENLDSITNKILSNPIQVNKFF